MPGKPRENATGGRSKAAVELGVCILPLRKMGRWERQRKSTEKGPELQAQLTTISSQQAVEGSFPVIPKKTSSVPTCCLKEISYLPKRSHCLGILEQEAEGDCDSQRTLNPPHTASPPLQSPFKAPIHLHWVSVQSHDWDSWKTGENHLFHLPKLSLCCLCSPNQPWQDQEMLLNAYQQVKHHKLLGMDLKRGMLQVHVFCSVL